MSGLKSLIFCQVKLEVFDTVNQVNSVQDTTTGRFQISVENQHRSENQQNIKWISDFNN